MVSFSKIRGGRVAQAEGVSFEDKFKTTCRGQGITTTRIPDSCKQVNSWKLIRLRSPFDFVISWEGKTALIDTKSTQGEVFNNSAIDTNQVKELLGHERVGVVGGYVIWLRKSDRVIFMPATSLLRLSKSRGSFSETEPTALFLGNSKFDVRLVFKAPSRSPLLPLESICCTETD